MTVFLNEPKRVAAMELQPGDPLRETLLRLPDGLDEAQFDLIVPVLVRLAGVKDR